MRSNYARHESVYQTLGPSANGWNSPAVDQEILGYLCRLLVQAEIQPQAKLLEVGCGMGNLSLELHEMGYQVSGVDVSETAIGIAQRRLGSRPWMKRDITKPESWVDLSEFDCIVDGLCLHCITGDDRACLLSRMRDALRPGGCLLVMTMCGDPRSPALASRFCWDTRHIVADGVAERYLGNPWDLVSELRQAAFSSVEWRVEAGNSETGDQDMFLAVARR